MESRIMRSKLSLTAGFTIPLLLIIGACTATQIPATRVLVLSTIPVMSGTAVLQTEPSIEIPRSAPVLTQTLGSPSSTTTKVASSSISVTPSSTAIVPKIILFTVAPTTTHSLGEKMSMAWQAQGTQAKLCPYILTLSGPSAQEQACSNVPLVGTKTITITQNDLDWNGIMLQVTSGTASDQSTISISLGCEGLYNWFFRNPPTRCPGAAPITSPAAAQYFERGMMIWMKQPDRFYVFYNENPQAFEWIEAPYRFKPGASADKRVGETPPFGLLEPVSGFGQLWRGEIEGVQNVRQRLGWAREPEFDFNTEFQCERFSATFRLWTCYLQSPNGKLLVLGPDSTAQARFIWKEH